MKRFRHLYRHAKELKRQGVIRKKSAFRWALERWRAGDDFVNLNDTPAKP